MPAPTLEFGSICLQNAMFLLPSPNHLAGGEDNWSGEEVKAPPKHVSTLPGLPTSGDSLKDLQYVTTVFTVNVHIMIMALFLVCFRCSILACRAYAALWLGDPVLALKSAKKLLDVENLPGGLK